MWPLRDRMNRDPMNINRLNRNRLSSLDPHQRPEQPSITDILKEDPLSALCLDWRRLQFTDRKRLSRRYLLPLIRVTCLILGWTILAFKRLIPLQLGSQRLLNWLSRIFMKYFVSPEAQEMLYRHFSIENALVHFVIQNSDASDIQSVTLKPACPEQLGDISGTNATLMHDTIMLNLFADLGKSKDADIKVGDFVSSSPASSLLPPNIPIGIVKSIDNTLQSKKMAKILQK